MRYRKQTSYKESNMSILQIQILRKSIQVETTQYINHQYTSVLQISCPGEKEKGKDSPVGRQPTGAVVSLLLPVPSL